MYNMYIYLVFLWLLCWREAEEWLGVKAINVQQSGRVKIQKKKQVPRKTVACHKGMIPSKDHMALEVKQQGKLIIAYRNQRKELNEEEKGTAGNKERWKKHVVTVLRVLNTLRYHFPNLFPATRALLTLQNLLNSFLPPFLYIHEN